MIFGYSDDTAELRGAIYDEVSCYKGGTIYFDNGDLLKNECDDRSCPYYQRLKLNAKTIKIIWDKDGYIWAYETKIPHATFDILDCSGDDKFCRGIVFDIKSLK